MTLTIFAKSSMILEGSGDALPSKGLIVMLLKCASSFACPRCKGDLILRCKTIHNDRVEEGAFHCCGCELTFPITRGIPRFLLALAKVEEHTARSFAYKWERFKRIDEYYKKVFLDELKPLDYKTFFRGKLVLDAGTGMGIPCYCMAENGAKEIFAVDIHDSIEIAYENNLRFPNVIVVQSDIYEMPFKRESFDIIVCVAVLQHLPDPHAAFDELFSFVKPRGTLIIWVYGYEGNAFVRCLVEPFRRGVTRRLPLGILLGLSYLLGALFQLMARYFYRPLNNANFERLPLNEYIMYRANFGREMNTHMIFDQLLAPLSHFFTKKEVEELFNRPDVTNLILRHHNGNSWTAICDKSY